MKSIQRKSSRRKFAVLTMAAGAAGIASPAARADLTFLNAFGSSGSGNGQLDAPGYAAVAPNGNVYVTDSNNNRVAVFSATGAFVSNFGSSGTGNGQFDSPMGIAFAPNGDVVVADGLNNRVEYFNTASSNGYVGQWGSSGTGNGQFNVSYGLAVSPAGNAYVADFINRRVEIFDSKTNFTSAFGSEGSGAGQFDLPAGVALDSSGNIYVTDTTNDRFELFNSSGTYEAQLGSSGMSTSEFNDPQGIGVSATGMIYVADTGNNRIQVFNSSGNFQYQFGTSGSGNGQLDFPIGVTPTVTGMVYVVDSDNDRVERLFDPNSWVSGTNTFTNSAVGPTTVTVGSGQILGTSLMLGSSMGLVATTTNINSGGTLAEAGGSLSTGGMSVTGTFNYNGGSFSASQTLSVNAGGIVNAKLGGSMSLGQSLIVGGTGAQFNLDGGTSLTQANTTNINAGGLMSLGNATYTIDGGNSLVLFGGELRLGSASRSVVTFSGGGELANEGGTVDGSGTINGFLFNTSQVTVAASQNLTINGSGNSNVGQITVAGGAISFTNGLTNTGTLTLGGNALVSQFYGTLTNNSGGTLNLTGLGVMENNLINAAGGTIHVSGNAENNLNGTGGSTTNSGAINIDSGSNLYIIGSYSGGGTINNAGTLSFGSTSTIGAVTGNGSLSIDPGVIVHLNSSTKTNTQGSLSLLPAFEGTPGGTLDITDNAIVINYGTNNSSPVATIAGEIKSGYNGALWNGAGINSSKVAAANVLVTNNHAYAVAYADGGDAAVAGDGFARGTIVIEPAIVGDANLDGKVNYTDFQLLSASFNGVNTTWDQGNFNYGAGTSYVDFQLLSANFNDSTSLDNAEFDAMNALALSHGQTLVANADGDGFTLVNVPEPASVGMIGIAAVGLLARRRRCARG